MSTPKDRQRIILSDNNQHPSKPVSTRRQLATDALWCYFHAFVVKEEPKNYKEAMLESSWIEAMRRRFMSLSGLKYRN
ncbi:hypothetical protein Tco_0426752, partial [Tanacetum coccineum]